MPDRGRGRPAGTDASEVDRDILAVAHKLFMEQGYRAVSTRQIAALVGVSQPALYHHFANKQELYLAVLRAELTRVATQLEGIRGHYEGVADGLRQVVSVLPAVGEAIGQMFHDIDHELDRATQLAVHQSFREAVVAPIAAIFAEGLRRGELRGPEQNGTDPVSAAYLLLGMLHNRRPSSANSADTAQHAALIVEVLLHGLAATNI